VRSFKAVEGRDPGRKSLLLLILLFALGGGALFAQQPDATTETTSADAQSAPADSSGTLIPVVCNVDVQDVPNDGGRALRVSWALPETPPGGPEITAFSVLRYSPGESPEEVGIALPTETTYVDDTVEDGRPYQYIVRTLTDRGSADSEPSPEGVSVAQWFALNRLNVFIIAILFTIAVLFYLQMAKRGAELYIRKIPGLEAVDDAVGRATEMGRPVLFVPGIETVSEVGTLAALTILGHVAKRVAQHGTPLEVPCADPIVMATAQEIVKTAYTEVGQPDNYDASKVSYLTYDQFGYTAGVDGIMVRERPEAVFLLGTFYAESLILAETGHAIGAIQIAGTKETSQLPFFVAACDYTLIGEELFAASSYLSREPIMLGSLKGQDLAKLWIVYFIVAAFIVGTIGTLASREGSSIFTKAFDMMSSWFG
jgi:hypothetical protein